MNRLEEYTECFGKFNQIEILHPTKHEIIEKINEIIDFINQKENKQ